ncbi:MAG TPA: hypothetical protein VFZ16_16830 [Hyphomicrobiaceae bacterium]|nr:hypothetical protein [Hyphomicrobiaceae bacterium]
MSVVSADIPRPHGDPYAGASRVVPFRLAVTLAAFGLYWLSAVILQARDATLVFGADAHLYAMLMEGPVDRLTRFHPLTTAMVTVWLKLLAPLTVWIAPKLLFKALFAAVGAAGVWAAIGALEAVGGRRHALLWGIVYASALSVWYFSSIEESKIVTTTLTAFYIAVYLRLRTAWSLRDAALLTGLLLLACLNEIVAAFLVAIPAVDALVQHGWNVRRQLRRNWWIACHALAAPAAFLFLELVVNGWLVPRDGDPEGASHLSMLLYYLARHELSAAAVYDFATRWLFFAIAAPSIEATWGAGDNYMGDFPPGLMGYLGSPLTTALALVAGAALAVSLLPRQRGKISRDTAGLMLGLACCALLRALFFFLVYPGEYMLFASAAVLPHLMLVAIPFAASAYPRKQGLLGGLAALLFIVNGSFILGP